MIAGVIRLWPSQETPAYGSENVSGADRGAVGARLDVLEREGAVGLRLRLEDAASALVAELDGDPGQAELLLLDLAGRAAAGLEVSPDDAGDPAGERLGHDGLLGACRNLGSADAREAELRDVARRERLLEHEAARRPSLEGVGRGLCRGEDARRRHGVLHDRDRGVDRALGRVLLVHQPPDHARGEERDRHRHEDDDLERDREADPLEEDGEHEPDRGDERRHDQEPEEVVLDRGDERVVGEERLVVVEPDELVTVAVVEAPDDRADRRVDDPDAQQDERRREEDERDAVALEEARLVVARWKPPRGGFHR